MRSLKFSKISGKLYVGKTMQLSPVIKPADATNKKCAWSSSNDKVAMVNSEGKVYAIAAGTAVITAKLQMAQVRRRHTKSQLRKRTP